MIYRTRFMIVTLKCLRAILWQLCLTRQDAYTETEELIEKLEIYEKNMP